MPDVEPIAREVARLLISRGETLAVAESSAGGLISAALLAIPGASAFFLGGAVVYTRLSRGVLLGIPDEALADSRLPCRLLGALDRRRVIVEAVEARFRKGLSHDDGRGAMAATDIGDARATLELRLDAVERGQPFADEMRGIAAAEEPLGAAKQAGIVLVPTDTLAGAERLGDLGLVADHRGDDLESAGHEGRAALLSEDHRLFGRQRIAPARRIVLGIAGGRLRRQPFADIALRGAGAARQLRGGQRPGIRHMPVKTEPVADEDERRRHRGAEIADHLADERIELGFIHGHDDLPGQDAFTSLVQSDATIIARARRR